MSQTSLAGCRLVTQDSAAAKLGSYTARVATGDFGNAHLQQPPRFRVSDANSFCQLSNFRRGMIQRSNPLYAIPRDIVQECRPPLFLHVLTLTVYRISA
jgi:hypothetical protein